jgi:hypothetical protein
MLICTFIAPSSEYETWKARVFYFPSEPKAFQRVAISEETSFSERIADGVDDKISEDKPCELGTEDRRFVVLSLLPGNYSHLN